MEKQRTSAAEEHLRQRKSVRSARAPNVDGASMSSDASASTRTDVNSTRGVWPVSTPATRAPQADLPVEAGPQNNEWEEPTVEYEHERDENAPPLRRAMPHYAWRQSGNEQARAAEHARRQEQPQRQAGMEGEVVLPDETTEDGEGVGAVLIRGAHFTHDGVFHDGA